MRACGLSLLRLFVWCCPMICRASALPDDLRWCSHGPLYPIWSSGSFHHGSCHCSVTGARRHRPLTAICERSPSQTYRLFASIYGFALEKGRMKPALFEPAVEGMSSSLFCKHTYSNGQHATSLQTEKQFIPSSSNSLIFMHAEVDVISS
ncbi:hypothetical protein EJB05_34061, partial [Eragrostis curvula]